MWIEDKIAWDQGVFICKETSKLYNENFSSAKDELGFARLVIASGVDATIGEYDLTFDEETPNELILTTNMKFSSDIKSDVENKLMKYTCVLIGAAEQLEKVTYNYFIDDEVETLTINEADVERFAGVSVKEQFKSPKDLQEMLYSIEFIES